MGCTPSASPRVGPLRDFLQRVAPGELGVFTEDERIVTAIPWTFWVVYDMLDPNFRTLWGAVDEKSC